MTPEIQHPEILDRIAVVLVRPQGDGNVGQVARAMKNFGLSHMILVDPCDVDTNLARQMASGTYDIIENAKRCANLKDALRDFHYVIGTSRRKGKWRPRFCTSRALPGWLLPQLGNDRGAALVFGNEAQGLSMDELDCCNQVVEIETDPGHKSLNLAQAVVILAYELFAHAVEMPANVDQNEMADYKSMERLYDHMRRIYLEVGFIDEESADRILRALRHLYSRAAPTPREVRILRGILQDTEWYFDHIAEKGTRNGERKMAGDGEPGTET